MFVSDAFLQHISNLCTQVKGRLGSGGSVLKSAVRCVSAEPRHRLESIVMSEAEAAQSRTPSVYVRVYVRVMFGVFTLTFSRRDPPNPVCTRRNSAGQVLLSSNTRTRRSKFLAHRRLIAKARKTRPWTLSAWLCLWEESGDASVVSATLLSHVWCWR